MVADRLLRSLKAELAILCVFLPPLRPSLQAAATVCGCPTWTPPTCWRTRRSRSRATASPYIPTARSRGRRGWWARGERHGSVTRGTCVGGCAAGGRQRGPNYQLPGGKWRSTVPTPAGTEVQHIASGGSLGVEDNALQGRGAPANGTHGALPSASRRRVALLFPWHSHSLACCCDHTQANAAFATSTRPIKRPVYVEAPRMIESRINYERENVA